MLLIKRNELNNMVVTVSQNKTLTSPYYLFSFQHILSKETVRFYPKNITELTSDRYDEFEFFEGEEPVGYTGNTPYVQFPFDGQYYYGVYEMVSSGSTNPMYAFEKLEEGRAVVENDTDPEYYDTYTLGNENNENGIYYGDDFNKEFVVINSFYGQYNNQEVVFNWVDIYPPLKIINNYTNKTTYEGFDVSTLNSCGYPTSAYTNTFQLQFNTGGTGNIYYGYDADDLITYDYGWVGTPFYISAATLNNFDYVSGSTYSYEEKLYSSNGAIFGPVTKYLDINQSFELTDIGLISGATFCIPPSPTPTPTASVTPTPTITPTLTQTASVTPTPTITPTLTQTTTQTPTPTTTQTPTPTITASITPTVSYTPTQTPTPTITPSATPNFFNILTESGSPIDTENDNTLNTEDAP